MQVPVTSNLFHTIPIVCDSNLLTSIVQEVIPADETDCQTKQTTWERLYQLLLKKNIINENGEWIYSGFYAIPKLDLAQMERLEQLLKTEYVITMRTDYGGIKEATMTLEEIFQLFAAWKIDLIGSGVLWILGKEFFQVLFENLKINVPASLWKELLNEDMPEDFDFRLIPPNTKEDKSLLNYETMESGFNAIINFLCIKFNTNASTIFKKIPGIWKPQKNDTLQYSIVSLEFHSRTEKGLIKNFTVDLMPTTILRRYYLKKSDSLKIRMERFCNAYGILCSRIMLLSNAKRTSNYNNQNIAESLIHAILRKVEIKLFRPVDERGFFSVLVGLSKGCTFFDEQLLKKLFTCFRELSFDFFFPRATASHSSKSNFIALATAFNAYTYIGEVACQQLFPFLQEISLLKESTLNQICETAISLSQENFSSLYHLLVVHSILGFGEDITVFEQEDGKKIMLFCEDYNPQFAEKERQEEIETSDPKPVKPLVIHLNNHPEDSLTHLIHTTQWHRLTQLSSVFLNIIDFRGRKIHRNCLHLIWQLFEVQSIAAKKLAFTLLTKWHYDHSSHPKMIQVLNQFGPIFSEIEPKEQSTYIRYLFEILSQTPDKHELIEILQLQSKIKNLKEDDYTQKKILELFFRSKLKTFRKWALDFSFTHQVYSGEEFFNILVKLVYEENLDSFSLFLDYCAKCDSNIIIPLVVRIVNQGKYVSELKDRIFSFFLTLSPSKISEENRLLIGQSINDLYEISDIKTELFLNKICENGEKKATILKLKRNIDSDIQFLESINLLIQFLESNKNDILSISEWEQICYLLLEKLDGKRSEYFYKILDFFSHNQILILIEEKYDQWIKRILSKFKNFQNPLKNDSISLLLFLGNTISQIKNTPSKESLNALIVLIKEHAIKFSVSEKENLKPLIQKIIQKLVATNYCYQAFELLEVCFLTSITPEIQFSDIFQICDVILTLNQFLTQTQVIPQENILRYLTKKCGEHQKEYDEKVTILYLPFYLKSSLLDNALQSIKYFSNYHPLILETAQLLSSEKFWHENWKKHWQLLTQTKQNKIEQEELATEWLKHVNLNIHSPVESISICKEHCSTFKRKIDEKILHHKITLFIRQVIEKNPNSELYEQSLELLTLYQIKDSEIWETVISSLLIRPPKNQIIKIKEALIINSLKLKCDTHLLILEQSISFKLYDSSLVPLLDEKVFNQSVYFSADSTKIIRLKRMLFQNLLGLLLAGKNFNLSLYQLQEYRIQFADDIPEKDLISAWIKTLSPKELFHFLNGLEDYEMIRQLDFSLNLGLIEFCLNSSSTSDLENIKTLRICTLIFQSSGRTNVIKPAEFSKALQKLCESILNFIELNPKILECKDLCLNLFECLHLHRALIAKETNQNHFILYEEILSVFTLEDSITIVKTLMQQYAQKLPFTEKTLFKSIVEKLIPRLISSNDSYPVLELLQLCISNSIPPEIQSFDAIQLCEVLLESEPLLTQAQVIQQERIFRFLTQKSGERQKEYNEKGSIFYLRFYLQNSLVDQALQSIQYFSNYHESILSTAQFLSSEKFWNENWKKHWQLLTHTQQKELRQEELATEWLKHVDLAIHSLSECISILKEHSYNFIKKINKKILHNTLTHFISESIKNKSDIKKHEQLLELLTLYQIKDSTIWNNVIYSLLEKPTKNRMSEIKKALETNTFKLKPDTFLLVLEYSIQFHFYDNSLIFLLDENAFNESYYFSIDSIQVKKIRRLLFLNALGSLSIRNNFNITFQELNNYRKQFARDIPKKDLIQAWINTLSPKELFDFLRSLKNYKIIPELDFPLSKDLIEICLHEPISTNKEGLKTHQIISLICDRPGWEKVIEPVEFSKILIKKIRSTCRFIKLMSKKFDCKDLFLDLFECFRIHRNCIISGTNEKNSGYYEVILDSFPYIFQTTISAEDIQKIHHLLIQSIIGGSSTSSTSSTNAKAIHPMPENIVSIFTPVLKLQLNIFIFENILKSKISEQFLSLTLDIVETHIKYIIENSFVQDNKKDDVHILKCKYLLDRFIYSHLFTSEVNEQTAATLEAAHWKKAKKLINQATSESGILRVPAMILEYFLFLEKGSNKNIVGQYKQSILSPIYSRILNNLLLKKSSSFQKKISQTQFKIILEILQNASPHFFTYPKSGFEIISNILINMPHLCITDESKILLMNELKSLLLTISRIETYQTHPIVQPQELNNLKTIWYHCAKTLIPSYFDVLKNFLSAENLSKIAYRNIYLQAYQFFCHMEKEIIANKGNTYIFTENCSEFYELCLNFLKITGTYQKFMVNNQKINEKICSTLKHLVISQAFEHLDQSLDLLMCSLDPRPNLEAPYTPLTSLINDEFFNDKMNHEKIGDQIAEKFLRTRLFVYILLRLENKEIFDQNNQYYFECLNKLQQVSFCSPDILKNLKSENSLMIVNPFYFLKKPVDSSEKADVIQALNEWMTKGNELLTN